MNAEAKPNWYDDGHGQDRWWDGKGWTAHTRPLSSSAALPATTGADATAVLPVTEQARGASAWSEAAATASRTSPRMRRGLRVLLPVTVAVVAFVFGVTVGEGSASEAAPADPTTSSAYVKLQSTAKSLIASRDDLQDQVDSMSAHESELKTRESELADLQTKLDARETKLAKRSKNLDVRARKLTRASSASTADDSAATPSTYYQNCDAVRAAGAAPITQGDPGYSRSLDRDGDGVGCE